MGWSDSPKVENWHDDIQTIEQELERRNQIPDLIYTSALGRARHTGEHLGEHFERNVEHCQLLNEVNYGELAEKSKKWVAAHYPLHKMDPFVVLPV